MALISQLWPSDGNGAHRVMAGTAERFRDRQGWTPQMGPGEEMMPAYSRGQMAANGTYWIRVGR